MGSFFSSGPETDDAQDEGREMVAYRPAFRKGFVQANAWQATFGLSHDIPGLARKMGGEDSLAVRLDEAFWKSAAADFLFSYVSYANQPGCSSAHVFPT